MKTADRATRGLKIVGIILYVLAGIVAVLGVYFGLSFANAPAAISGFTFLLGMPALQPLWDALASGLVMVGIVLLVFSLIMSALLVSLGLLLRRSAALSLRIERLEVALAQAPEARNQQAERLVSQTA